MSLCPDPSSEFEVLDALDELVFVLSKEGRPLFANRAARSELGERCGELLTAELAPVLPAALCGGGRLETKIRVGADPIDLSRTLRVRPFGERFLVTLGAARPSGGLAERLKTAEQRLRWVTESIDDFFYLIDPASGQMSFASPAYETIWGRTRASLYSDAGSALEAVLPEDKHLIADQIPIQESKSHFNLEYRIRRPDGSVRCLHDRGFVVREDNGEITHYVGIATDITERKALQDATLQAQRLEAVGRLTAQLAHDFNNILGTIRLLASNAEDCDPAGARLPELEKIRAAADRGSDIIRTLLAASRQEELAPAPCDLHEAIRESQALVETVLGPSIEMRTICEIESATLEVDRTAFARSLLNLAINAHDSMASGGVFTLKGAKRTITRNDLLATANGLKAGDYVCIEAIDSGVGMSPDAVAKAFDPFFTTKPAGFGAGLGLSIVYGFCRQSGGAAEIESKPGAGTTVRLLLPARFERVAAADAPAPPTVINVLLVDDEPLLLEGLATFLSRRGFDVVTAGGGLEALGIMRTSSFDIIVTDSKMPGMSGVELAERIRAAMPDMPVIVMSGFTKDLEGLSGQWPVVPKATMLETIIPTIQAQLSTTA